MKNIASILSILCLLTAYSYADTFDSLSPVNPIAEQPPQKNSIALSVKKATLTHNDIHNQYALALDRFMQSNVKSAYGDFKILIETISPNDYVYLKIAESMADIGFFNLSELALSKVNDKNISGFLADDIRLYYYPSDKLKPDDEMYLGEVFSNIIYNDQSKEATSELVKNTELLSRSDYANYIAALGYLKSNEFAEAAVYIDKAIKMNAQNINYKKLKAEILSQGKKPQNALKLVENIKSQKLYSTDFTNKVNSMEQYVLYKSKKNYSEKMYHLGYYYYYENEPAKAVRTLQSALSTKKKLNKDVYAILARVYFDTQDYEKALDAGIKSDKSGGDNPIALMVLGDINYRNKDYKSALKYYKKAECYNKNSYVPLIGIAQTYEQMQNTKKAYEIYEKILKTYNNCCIAYYKMAQKDKTRDISLLKKSIEINVNFVDAWVDLAKISIERDNFSDAKQYLRVLNYIDDNDYRYYYYQGMLAKKQGLDGSAYFKKSLIMNPDYQPAKEELKI